MAAMTRPRLLKWQYFLWVLPASFLFWMVGTHGTPHMLWSYEFRGATYPTSGRVYTSCTYIGKTGAVVRPAERGTCSFVRLVEDAN